MTVTVACASVRECHPSIHSDRKQRLVAPRPQPDVVAGVGIARSAAMRR
jgi:hypothetical protein